MTQVGILGIPNEMNLAPGETISRNEAVWNEMWVSLMSAEGLTYYSNNAFEFQSTDEPMDRDVIIIDRMNAEMVYRFFRKVSHPVYENGVPKDTEEFEFRISFDDIRI